jgi:hypothetical protein
MFANVCVSMLPPLCSVSLKFLIFCLVDFRLASTKFTESLLLATALLAPGSEWL